MSLSIIENSIVTSDDATAVSVGSNSKTNSVVFRMSAGSVQISCVWEPDDAERIAKAILDASVSARKQGAKKT